MSPEPQSMHLSLVAPWDAQRRGPGGQALLPIPALQDANVASPCCWALTDPRGPPSLPETHGSCRLPPSPPVLSQGHLWAWKASDCLFVTGRISPGPGDPQARLRPREPLLTAPAPNLSPATQAEQLPMPSPCLTWPCPQEDSLLPGRQ